MGFEAVAATGFLEEARRSFRRPAIVPLRPSLTPPGAETARLEGHSERVTALCVLPDGRLASGSYDNTIRLWDVATGAETARLEGHSGRVAALCLLPDGRLASGSWDNTIRLWDVDDRRRDRPPRGALALRSPRCACCRTGGSPRAPRTTRSGCGT